MFVIKKVEKTDAEWRDELGALEYFVLRQKGTEKAFTGRYNAEKRAGTYLCAGCSAPLFSSEQKLDSRSGWPSFRAPVTRENIQTAPDLAYGVLRTEVKCARCDGHLGHVFDDGTAPAGLRYCINSAALTLEEPQEKG